MIFPLVACAWIDIKNAAIQTDIAALAASLPAFFMYLFICPFRIYLFLLPLIRPITSTTTTDTMIWISNAKSPVIGCSVAGSIRESKKVRAATLARSPIRNAASTAIYLIKLCLRIIFFFTPFLHGKPAAFVGFLPYHIGTYLITLPGTIGSIGKQRRLIILVPAVL